MNRICMNRICMGWGVHESEMDYIMSYGAPAVCVHIVSYLLCPMSYL